MILEAIGTTTGSAPERFGQTATRVVQSLGGQLKTSNAQLSDDFLRPVTANPAFQLALTNMFCFVKLGNAKRR